MLFYRLFTILIGNHSSVERYHWSSWITFFIAFISTALFAAFVWSDSGWPLGLKILSSILACFACGAQLCESFGYSFPQILLIISAVDLTVALRILCEELHKQIGGQPDLERRFEAKELLLQTPEHSQTSPHIIPPAEIATRSLQENVEHQSESIDLLHHQNPDDRVSDVSHLPNPYEKLE